MKNTSDAVTSPQSAGDAGSAHGHDNQGHVTFQFTYDNTGAVVTVEAPNGWRMRDVIAEAYRLLGETQRQGDRVEFDGADLSPDLDLHVKQFIERGIAPGAHLDIVSDTGGAVGARGTNGGATGHTLGWKVSR